MSDKGDEGDSDVDSNDNDDEVDNKADGEADGEVDLDDNSEVDLDDNGEIDLDGFTVGSTLHFNFRKKARSSAVWKFFDDNLPGKSEKRVCKKCKQEFSKGTGVSTLRLLANQTSQISAILDPRNKLSAFKNEQESEDAKRSILELVSYCKLPIEEKATTIIGDNIIDTRNYFRRLRQKNNNLPVNVPNNNSTAAQA
ncbi:14018_t:CDS:2 [Funneliformis caledonium]|uniref:14018_t:CDS:1 n=1 Tax=Funneliformis caledonium TaxID=1117310 RepID=A0A9N9FS44_9GLOM|nr:14018_t:CDS:2 [Funneliformis caledonium]